MLHGTGTIHQEGNVDALGGRGELHIAAQGAGQGQGHQDHSQRGAGGRNPGQALGQGTGQGGNGQGGQERRLAPAARMATGDEKEGQGQGQEEEWIGQGQVAPEVQATLGGTGHGTVGGGRDDSAGLGQTP